MKYNKLIIIFSFILMFTDAHAHQDFWIKFRYGNVVVRIKTGFHYEEIDKTFMIGQLAQELSSELNYSKPIFLDFSHAYTHTIDPDYFISYDKGQIKDSWNNYKKDKSPIQKKAIVIRQVSRKFDANKTLQLLEYAILNIESIKKNQAELKYEKNYSQWKINSIDTTTINHVLDEPISETILEVNKIKIERRIKEKAEPLSYYLLGNNYTCYLNSDSGDTIKLLTISNIYDIVYYGDSIALVFENFDSFYFIDLLNQSTSDKILIEDPSDYYRPFYINSVSNDQVEIYYTYFGDRRTLIYNFKNNSLSQRINK